MKSLQKCFYTLIFAISLIFIGNAQDSSPDLFVGCWEIKNEQEKVFSLQVNPDGSAETNRLIGEAERIQERGYWSLQKYSIAIQFDSGMTLRLGTSEKGYECITFSDILSATNKNSKTYKAVRLEAESIWPEIAEEEFVGYWKLKDEKDEVFYLNTRYDHEAQSTYADGINGVFGEIGIWRYERNRIVVMYNSGWVDVITKVEDRFLKFSYAPGQRIHTKPNNYSTAEKIEVLPVGRK